MRLNGKLFNGTGGEMAVVDGELVRYGVGNDPFLYYKGTFLNGKRHGIGREAQRWHPCYIGEYKEGKRHGKGTHYHANAVN